MDFDNTFKSIMFMLFGNEPCFHDDFRAEGNVMKRRIGTDEVDLKKIRYF